MFVPVEDWHINELAVTMQQEDIKSIAALTGMSPLQGSLKSVENSLESTAYILDGKVAAISGLSKTSWLSEWACPWLLCSDVIRQHPKVFLRETKRQTYEWLERHLILRNFVHVDHSRSIRWLEWLGFTIYPAKPIGVNGAMFHLNELELRK